MKRMLWLLPALILFVCAPASAEYSQADRDYKAAHLNELAPYGPGTNEALRPVWKQLIRICAEQGDNDIADAIFGVMARTDGITSTQYGLDLYDLFRANPLFFVEATERYFRGDFSRMLWVWINEVGDVSVFQLEEQLAPLSDNPQVEKFLSTARRMHREMLGQP